MSDGCYEDKKPLSMLSATLIQESSSMKEDVGKFWTTINLVYFRYISLSTYLTCHAPVTYRKTYHLYDIQWQPYLNRQGLSPNTLHYL